MHICAEKYTKVYNLLNFHQANIPVQPPRPGNTMTSSPPNPIKLLDYFSTPKDNHHSDLEHWSSFVCFYALYKWKHSLFCDWLVYSALYW